jgi:O-antigen/teichoic acid export membrane protein
MSAPSQHEDRAADTARTEGDGANPTTLLGRVAMRGALWVSATAAIALPLAYYRNWALGRIDPEGGVVGAYALIVLFMQVVIAFVLLGGVSTVTNFLPKIHARRDKFSFLASYAAISLVAVGLFEAVIFLQPDLVDAVVRRTVSPEVRKALALLAPLVVLAQLVTFALAGLMDFRLSAILGQIQIFLVSGVAAMGLLQPEFLRDDALWTLSLTIAAAQILVIAIGGTRVIRELAGGMPRVFLPPGFWRFTSYVHLNTLTTFAYLNIDQVLVLAALGVEELGGYFVMLQCAQLIRFIPQRIGQVMLASFSHLVSAGDNERLARAYTRLSRLIVVLATGITLILVLFSKQIGLLFGEWYAERHLFLVLLAVPIHVACLGQINSMLIMAKEKTGPFFAISVIQISVQLGLSLLFLDSLGTFAVILGKGAGLVIAQIGLFALVRWGLEGVYLAPPTEYWLSQVAVAAAAAFTLQTGGDVPLLAIGVAPVLGFGFLAAIRFRLDELISLLRSSSGGRRE